MSCFFRECTMHDGKFRGVLTDTVCMCVWLLLLWRGSDAVHGVQGYDARVPPDCAGGGAGGVAGV